MEEYNGQERRKHPRIDANFIINYHMQEEHDNYDLSQSKNVSQGGMLLTTNRKFEKRARLAMTIFFPFLDDKREVVGEVMDSNEVVEDFLYETRLRFYDFEKQLPQGFDNFINQHLESKTNN
jgi:c-di-GMP-binding flagellar brake protein YcgR